MRSPAPANSSVSPAPMCLQQPWTPAWHDPDSISASKPPLQQLSGNRIHICEVLARCLFAPALAADGQHRFPYQRIAVGLLAKVAEVGVIVGIFGPLLVRRHFPSNSRLRSPISLCTSAINSGWCDAMCFQASSASAFVPLRATCGPGNPGGAHRTAGSRPGVEVRSAPGQPLSRSSRYQCQLCNQTNAFVRIPAFSGFRSGPPGPFCAPTRAEVPPSDRQSRRGVPGALPRPAPALPATPLPP